MGYLNSCTHFCCSLPRMQPSPSLSLVVELQAAGGVDIYGQVQRLVSLGWARMSLFDQYNQVRTFCDIHTVSQTHILARVCQQTLCAKLQTWATRGRNTHVLLLFPIAQFNCLCNRFEQETQHMTPVPYSNWNLQQHLLWETQQSEQKMGCFWKPKTTFKHRAHMYTKSSAVVNYTLIFQLEFNVHNPTLGQINFNSFIIDVKCRLTINLILT